MKMTILCADDHIISIQKAGNDFSAASFDGLAAEVKRLIFQPLNHDLSLELRHKYALG
ncbi:hypothetical protein [Vibrio metoecus]|uniref:hypothetical protein n=2 Tax=Vibrio metoecus TaxID=1481663 RepID=UPI0012D845D2|nr:hypothetical protein [Vibrio metoecus]